MRVPNTSGTAMERAVIRTHALPFLLAGVATVGCGERTLPRRAQLLVYFDTDAPLALAPSQRLTPTTPTPLFDRLRVEVLTPDGEPACDLCLEDFSVDQGLLARGELSLGVLPKDGPLVLRTRLFRGVRARGGVPVAGATIERIVALPTPKAGELAEVTVFLPLESLGVAASLESPEPPITGKVVTARVHGGTVPTACTTQGGDGQLCILGGAYWMSDPLVQILADGKDPPERVAVVSPFWVDATEVTVGTYRASGQPTKDIGRSRGSTTECTFTEAPGANEALPLTCISWNDASAYCKAKGSRLLTEAEFEFMASGRRSARAPWGDDKAGCDDAVLARADPATLETGSEALGACAAVGIGPTIPGVGRRDRIATTGGDVVDIYGNVAEWVEDEFDALTGPCWGYGTVFDPVCKNPALVGVHPARGLHFQWGLNPASTSRFVGNSGETFGLATEALGFRCARAGL
jgi:formylglycine-generating enzyme required for sulfatase activity